MAFRLDSSIVQLEIDNRLEGHVMGKVWLVNRPGPIRLSLKGNCLRDIAGHRLVFENPDPEPGQDVLSISELQEGVVGDITASRKVFIPEVDIEEAYALRKEGKDVPMSTANCLYMEWFSETNGRVVIESPWFEITEFSEPAWQMSPEQGQKQEDANLHAMADFMEKVDTAFGAEDWEPQEDEAPMDEFEWEKQLKESDALGEKFQEILDKYADHPDRDRLTAREMGWDWLDDALDADDRGLFDDEKEAFEQDLLDFELPDPNPLTEGIDWIKDGNWIIHPLTHRARENAMAMWHKCKAAGLIEDEGGDEDLLDMLFHAQQLGAKLAGALNNLAFDHRPEPGFVVALLKRALTYFNGAIVASARVEEKGLVKEDDLRSFRAELFGVREEMLTLMKRFRSTDHGEF